MADTMNSTSMHHDHSATMRATWESRFNWRTDYDRWFPLVLVEAFFLAFTTMMFAGLATHYDTLFGGRLSKKVTAEDGEAQETRPRPPKPSLFRQLGKSILETICVYYTYILVLYIITYNGYIIITVLAGTFVGAFLADWLVLRVNYKRELMTLAPASLEPRTQHDCAKHDPPQYELRVPGGQAI